MEKEYIYPQNMKSQGTMWLWSLKDFAIIVIGALISAVIMTTTGFMIPGAAIFVYGVISIRNDEMTVLDYLKSAVNFFILKQQTFYWRKT